jgi:hypothetical protein
MSAPVLPNDATSADPAERSLLGALLIDGSLLARLDGLRPDDFLREAHGAIFTAIRALADRGDGVDLVTVQGELEKTEWLERAGGAAGLSALVDRVPDVENVESYARTVREASRRRRLLADLAEQRRALVGGARLEDISANITRALAAVAAPEAEATARPVLVTIAGVRRERVSWLWPGRVPFGKLTLLEGDPGLGKSTLALDLIARATTGRPMPDVYPQTLEPMTAIVLSAEDGLADTIRPRLEAAEADLSRVHALTAVKLPDGAEVFPTLTENLAQIRTAVIETEARIVVVDPFVAYIGAEVNSWRDQDVRRCLAPLAALAEEMGVAVILIRHLTKGGGSAAIYRGGGSIGIVAACRSALLVAKDPEDEDRRVLAPVKSNLCAPAPSLAYRMETRGDVARIAWEPGTVEMTAGELLAAQGEDDADADGASLLDEAVEFLADLLKSGAVGTGAVQKDARDAGHSWRTVRRAQKRLGIKPEKTADGWKWKLPATPEPVKVAKMAKPLIHGHLGHLGLDGDAKNAGNPLPERSGPLSGAPVQGGQGSEAPTRRRERLGL